MSSNNGTGFWVVVALIAAMSIVAMIEATMGFALGLASRRMEQWRTIVTSSLRGCGVDEASARSNT